MRIVLFCEQKYAVSILKPLNDEALRQKKHEVLWFIDKRNIPDFEDDTVNWTNNISELKAFAPDAIYVPCNIVPYDISGVKVQIFHGYAGEKKGHFRIRNYFDLYLTQGPYFTERFAELAVKYKDFAVMETGWTRQDFIFDSLNKFDDYKEGLLKKYNKKEIILYAPTFSPSLTSLPHLYDELQHLAEERKDSLILLKFHPLTDVQYKEKYKQLADSNDSFVWVDDYDVTRSLIVADMMISDTSSVVYEFSLMSKPVVTFRSIAEKKYWLDISEAAELCSACRRVMDEDEFSEKRKWLVENYDPYLDGKVSSRMLSAVEDYIQEYGVPQSRKLSLWRKYKCYKHFKDLR